MNSRSNPRVNAAVPLPVLSSGVLRRFRRTPPSFDVMLRQLHRYDPSAARWLYSAAEDIAPADVIEKERYATLALGLYYMLVEQSFIDQFDELLQQPSVSLRKPPNSAKTLPSDTTASV